MNHRVRALDGYSFPFAHKHPYICTIKIPDSRTCHYPQATLQKKLQSGTAPAQELGNSSSNSTALHAREGGQRRSKHQRQHKAEHPSARKEPAKEDARPIGDLLAFIHGETAAMNGTKKEVQKGKKGKDK